MPKEKCSVYVSRIYVKNIGLLSVVQLSWSKERSKYASDLYVRRKCYYSSSQGKRTFGAQLL